MRQLRLTAQDDLSDETLSARTRNGDDLAFSDLYRRHVSIARRTARCILHSTDDVDDVVAEAFTGVLAALRNGKGPRDNFRAYLLACVRNRCYVRRRPPTPIATEQLESLTPVCEDPERYVEADTVARAFASLRPRWQRTLWLTEVEQLPAADVAAELRLAPNATAALARRARQAFASAYLSEHLCAPPASAVCAEVGPRLGAYVRDDLGTAERAAVARHIAGCASCTHAVEQLDDLNGSLRSLQGPSVGLAAVGAGAGGLLAATAVGSGAFGAIAGASMLAKIAAAVLLVVPVAAIVTRQVSPAPDARGISAAVVVGLSLPPVGTSAGGTAGAAGSGQPGTPGIGGSGSTGPNSAVSPSVAVGVAAALSDATRNVPGGGIPVATPVLSTPPLSVPRIGLPGVTLPDVTPPRVNMPRVTLPSVTLPSVTLPGVSVPGVSLPGVSLPGVSLPGVTVPSVTVRSITVPSITVPAVTLPSVTLPSITVPPVTIPALTIPALTIPAITLPPIGLLIVG